jgi:RNA polymerase sigma-70 factor (ECF subfamily)
LAEDLASEVFIEIWLQAGSFKGKSQVSTWILAIARYKALSALRVHSDEQLNDCSAATIADPADDAETTMSKRDLGATIRKCLAQLSAAHREVLDLVYYHERSVGEVAEIVGVPVSTVKTRMFYARKRMENVLKANGVGSQLISASQ